MDKNAKRTKKLQIKTQWGGDETEAAENEEAEEKPVDNTEELYRTTNQLLNKLTRDNFENIVRQLADLRFQICFLFFFAHVT